MPQNITHVFPTDFIHKLINFPTETLSNLFKLCREALYRFTNNELNTLDPLVSENACHTRAFTLAHLSHKYQDHRARALLNTTARSLDKIIQKIQTLPAINEHSGQTIESYLQEHGLYLALDSELLFDLKFIFLSHVLTVTKKQFPSLSFMLHEKTCLEALSTTGLVHNKLKSLVSSAQKELSALSCQFIQTQSALCGNDALTRLLVVRKDDHHRSYLPQYSTAKVMLLRALQKNIALIIKVSRFVHDHYHDEIVVAFVPSQDKREFVLTNHIDSFHQSAIICEGIVQYADVVESKDAWIQRIGQHSMLQTLLANFAKHPQFSGNLKDTPCIYKEALENHHDCQSSVAAEWEAFVQHTRFAKKEGCSLENPHLLFLNHVFCDSTAFYQLHHFVPESQKSLHI